MQRRKAFMGAVLASVLFGGAAATTAAEDQWNEMLAKAREEGTVVLGTNQGNPKFRQGVSKAMEAYGVKVETRVLRGSELNAIVARECSVERPSMDLLLSGNSEVLRLYPKGCLAPLEPKLVLTEVRNREKWRGGVLKWTDPENKFLLQTAEPLYGSVAMNTELIKPGQIRTAQDLLDPSYKGKITSYDPRRGGAGQSDATYLVSLFGEEFVRRLFIDQEVGYTANHRQLADGIARGVYAIGIGTVERAVEPLRKKGMPIAMVTLADAPGYLTGGSSVIKLVQGAPHPNAAAVLANWLASRKGQQVFTDVVGQPSRRTDVSLDKVPEYRIPKDGVEYLDTYAYDFYAKKRPVIRKRLIELLGR